MKTDSDIATAKKDPAAVNDVPTEVQQTTLTVGEMIEKHLLKGNISK